jgi:hypothetical protein
MAIWHRLGTKSELLDRGPLSAKVDRHHVAIFCYEGQ